MLRCSSFVRATAMLPAVNVLVDCEVVNVLVDHVVLLRLELELLVECVLVMLLVLERVVVVVREFVEVLLDVCDVVAV